MKDLYAENNLTMIKETEDDSKKWKDMPCSWIERSNVLICSHTTLNKSDFVWCKKLSRIKPGQYLGGRIHILKMAKLSKAIYKFKTILAKFVVRSLSCVWLFATPWTTACQASLSFNISKSLLNLMSIELVMPSNHLIFCCPLLLPSVFPSIRVFSSKLALQIR